MVIRMKKISVFFSLLLLTIPCRADEKQTIPFVNMTGNTIESLLVFSASLDEPVELLTGPLNPDEAVTVDVGKLGFTVMDVVAFDVSSNMYALWGIDTRVDFVIFITPEPDTYFSAYNAELPGNDYKSDYSYFVSELIPALWYQVELRDEEWYLDDPDGENFGTTCSFYFNDGGFPAVSSDYLGGEWEISNVVFVEEEETLDLLLVRNTEPAGYEEDVLSMVFRGLPEGIVAILFSRSEPIYYIHQEYVGFTY